MLIIIISGTLQILFGFLWNFNFFHCIIPTFIFPAHNQSLNIQTHTSVDPRSLCSVSVLNTGGWWCPQWTCIQTLLFMYTHVQLTRWTSVTSRLQTAGVLVVQLTAGPGGGVVPMRSSFLSLWPSVCSWGSCWVSVRFIWSPGIIVWFYISQIKFNWIALTGGLCEFPFSVYVI